MIRRIELTNYMSHASTVIEPADGLTVLAGPNNCGKSAVVDALRTLAGRSSSRGDYMVRHGAREASVSVVTDDGHTLTWTRRGAVIWHTIDGEKIPRDRPERIEDALRLDEVASEDGKKSFDVHFADQKHPIFLLDGPGTDPAVFFAASSDAARLLQMQQAHRQNSRERKTERDRLAKERDSATRKAEALDPVVAINAELARAEMLYGQIHVADGQCTQLAQTISQQESTRAQVIKSQALSDTCRTLQSPPAMHDTASLRQLLEDLDAERRMISRLEDQKITLESLAAPPALNQCGELQVLCHDLHTAADDRAKARDGSAALSPLQSPPPVQETADLHSLCSDLAGQQITARHMQQLCAAATLLAGPPEIVVTEGLHRDINDLADGLRHHTFASHALDAVVATPAPPELLAPQGLEMLLRDLELSHRDVNDYRTAQRTLDEQQSELELLQLNWLQRNPTCPFCNAPMSPARLRDGELNHVH